MDRALQRHAAAKAFMSHWVDNWHVPDPRVQQDLPFHVVLEDDLIGDVVDNVAMLHPDGANLIVATGTDGKFMVAALHAASKST